MPRCRFGYPLLALFLITDRRFESVPCTTRSEDSKMTARSREIAIVVICHLSRSAPSWMYLLAASFLGSADAASSAMPPKIWQPLETATAFPGIVGHQVRIRRPGVLVSASLRLRRTCWRGGSRRFTRSATRSWRRCGSDGRFVASKPLEESVASAELWLVPRGTPRDARLCRAWLNEYDRNHVRDGMTPTQPADGRLQTRSGMMKGARYLSFNMASAS
jgi:hypothetical protein